MADVVLAFGMTTFSPAIIATTVAALGFIGVNTSAADPAPAPCRSIDATGCTPPPPPGYELPDPTGGMSAD
jgi:hypothetical protein